LKACGKAFSCQETILFHLKAVLMMPTFSSRCQSVKEPLLVGWQATCNWGRMASETILLVEDDPAVSKALEQALKVREYCVYPVVGREQALLRLAQSHVDVCLLDLNLGVDKGWETFHHLTHFRPRLPIIVMSAQPDQFFHTAAGLAAGLLEKPFNVALLFQRLAAISPPAAKRPTHYGLDLAAWWAAKATVPSS
jgi:CheY-like chemotaxis protein